MHCIEHEDASYREEVVRVDFDLSICSLSMRDLLRTLTSNLVTHRVPLLVEWDEGGVVDLDDRTPRVVDERELARIRIRLTQEVDVTCEPTTARDERPLRPS